MGGGQPCGCMELELTRGGAVIRLGGTSALRASIIEAQKYEDASAGLPPISCVSRRHVSTVYGMGEALSGGRWLIAAASIDFRSHVWPSRALGFVLFLFVCSYL